MEDFVRVVAVELDESQRALARLPLLLGYESVETGDHVAPEAAHRPLVAVRKAAGTGTRATQLDPATFQRKVPQSDGFVAPLARSKVLYKQRDHGHYQWT